MEEHAVRIDDQPISATFFGENRWLTHFITPNALEVQSLHRDLVNGIGDSRGRIVALWKWVATLKYVDQVKGTTRIAGRTSLQRDLWLDPTTTIHVGRGNCATKSFLLCSLLRNELPVDAVYCVMGNLYCPTGAPKNADCAGGHAWINVMLEREYIMEATMPVTPLVPKGSAERYEAVHYFNDEIVFAVEGRTQMVPYAAAYSNWLSKYLSQSIINA